MTVLISTFLIHIIMIQFLSARMLVTFIFNAIELGIQVEKK